MTTERLKVPDRSVRLGSVLNRVHGSGDDLREIDMLQVEMYFSGCNSRQIQQGIHKVRFRFSAPYDRLKGIRRFFRRRFAGSQCLRPTGDRSERCRSSCDSMARNSSFARFARSLPPLPVALAQVVRCAPLRYDAVQLCLSKPSPHR